jgi:hypothetical protein
MMFSSNTCRFVLSFLSLSANLANAETVRGAQRELAVTTSVNLKTAGNYAILAKTGISTVPDSAITGNIAVSPIAEGAMTGFSFTRVQGDDFSTSSQIVGQATAASYGGDVETTLTTAVSDMETAYTDAKGRTNADAARINLGAGILGGDFGGANAKLTTGVYTFGTDVNIADTVYFHGSSTDIFVIQIAGNLQQAGNKNVILSGGALAKNIFWQVEGQVTVGAGAHMEGILLVKTAVTFVTGSSLNGRVLSQTACSLQVATITQPPVA